jgi:hypothetical protein
VTATIIVIAKAPRAGLSKTRLCPPLTSSEAARLARAALRDTLDTVTSIPNVDRVLALQGEPWGWRRRGWRVIPQRGDGLDERIAAAFAPLRGPVLLVGMDTPQLSARLLEEAVERLGAPEVDAVLGPAEDGGYWAVGLASPQAYPLDALFHGVPMSTLWTFSAQMFRFRSLGLRVSVLSTARDVDLFEDAVAVAEQAPTSRFAREWRALMAPRAMDVVW